jgi:hypothetical protein
VKIKKNPKNTLVWAKKPKKTQKNPKNPKKPKKTQKNPLGWVFLKKPGFFPTLILRAPKIMGACPLLVGGLVISSFSSLQLRVDDF